MVFRENFTGRGLRYSFNCPDTHKYMRPYITEDEGEEYDIKAEEGYLDRRRSFFPESGDASYIEYKSLINLTSLYLLPTGRCMIHAVAFSWQGLAWIISGPSGAGKTTQYKNWKKTHSKAVEMISGDMPLLEMKDDGILVHPTPWNGKERIKGKISAPLGGIVLLKQDDSDSIRRMNPEECAVPLFLQFAATPETEEQIIMLSGMADRIVRSYPVFELRNRGDDASAIMTAQAFNNLLIKEEVI